jgi:NAD(P)-dependent dehydrogenase (short-subunit alcohol dehydrogenase family)
MPFEHYRQQYISPERLGLTRARPPSRRRSPPSDAARACWSTTSAARSTARAVPVTAAQKVVDEIRAAGGEALANGASVTDFAAVQAMVQQALDAWGRVDVLVSNAGILRDKSFAKMDLADFRLVLDVHLMGAVHCCKALWPLMQQQKYGRIVLTTSSSGLYGNFGQANYGAAKMALVGLMQTLSIEGEKHGIRVNCLAPTATTRMTEDLFPPDMREPSRRATWCRRCWCWPAKARPRAPRCAPAPAASKPRTSR